MSYLINVVFDLGGITLNSAFDLKFGNKHLPLSDKKLAEFRNALADLKLIIIDEISLVKSDMLYQIHRRLCEIFPECHECFMTIWNISSQSISYPDCPENVHTIQKKSRLSKKIQDCPET